jgi:hypothetical protein
MCGLNSVWSVSGESCGGRWAPASYQTLVARMPKRIRRAAASGGLSTASMVCLCLLRRCADAGHCGQGYEGGAGLFVGGLRGNTTQGAPSTLKYCKGVVFPEAATELWRQGPVGSGEAWAGSVVTGKYNEWREETQVHGEGREPARLRGVAVAARVPRSAWSCRVGMVGWDRPPESMTCSFGGQNVGWKLRAHRVRSIKCWKGANVWYRAFRDEERRHCWGPAWWMLESQCFAGAARVARCRLD